MPGKVKVRIIAGRNLPVMDKSSDTSDAFVEVKLGNTTYKTEVYRHSLNPCWNSDCFRFEVDDEELQDEPLQIRIMDYDTYSANDAIGKVYIDLNPLLHKDSVHAMWGWFPIYDTMHGIRGEVHCAVKVDLFSDSNRYRQSSCGVRFFYSPGVPHGYVCSAILGFVEELVVNDDPEYQWIDKIRTPRASNEARQTLFSKLSGEVKRKIGLKALELGGNTVVGYQQYFDLEGESGIVVRGIGTAVVLSKVDNNSILRHGPHGRHSHLGLLTQVPGQSSALNEESCEPTVSSHLASSKTHQDSLSGNCLSCDFSLRLISSLQIPLIPIAFLSDIEIPFYPNPYSYPLASSPSSQPSRSSSPVFIFTSSPKLCNWFCKLTRVNKSGGGRGESGNTGGSIKKSSTPTPSLTNISTSGGSVKLPKLRIGLSKDAETDVLSEKRQRHSSSSRSFLPPNKPTLKRVASQPTTPSNFHLSTNHLTTTPSIVLPASSYSDRYFTFESTHPLVSPSPLTSLATTNIAATSSSNVNHPFRWLSSHCNDFEDLIEIVDPLPPSPSLFYSTSSSHQFSISPRLPSSLPSSNAQVTTPMINQTNHGSSINIITNSYATIPVGYAPNSNNATKDAMPAPNSFSPSSSVNVSVVNSDNHQYQQTSNIEVEPIPGANNSSTLINNKYGSPSKGQLHRRGSSDPDLSTTPTKPSSSHSSTCGSTGKTNIKFMISPENLHLLEYPFITMRQFPPGFIARIGGTVSSRSVKLLDHINCPEDPETRDAWWMELRKEIRSHCRSLTCNAVLGYSEATYICDNVVILSASGTAVVLSRGDHAQFINSNRSSTQDKAGKGDPENNSSSTNQSTATSTSAQTSSSSSTLSANKGEPNKSTRNHSTPDYQQSPSLSSSSSSPNCSICHIPYPESSVPFHSSLLNCRICKKAKVSDVLFMTIEPPNNIPIVGRGCLIQARVCRNKRDSKGEQCAKELSDSLPFLEHELHRQLLSKVKVKGMNAIFGLKVQISFGENMLIALATGTAAYVGALPPPDPPQISSGKGVKTTDLNAIQKLILESMSRNREHYGLTDIPVEEREPSEGEEERNGTKASDSDNESEYVDNYLKKVKDPVLDQVLGSKDGCVVLEVDDTEDADIISLMIDSDVPKGYEICNTETMPGLSGCFSGVLQTFAQVHRVKLIAIKQFGQQFDWIIQGLFVKLRRLVPCCLTDIKFHVDLPEQDLVQVTVLGSAIGIVGSSSLGPIGKGNLYLPASTTYRRRRTLSANDSCDELLFTMDEDHGSNSDEVDDMKKENFIPSETLSESNGIELTPLSYVPGSHIQKYLGNLDFFFIRETTSIRESGGLNGFIHSFLSEVFAIVRAHVASLSGNAMVSLHLTQCVLVHNPHKNQAQCLINIAGDIVSIQNCSTKPIPVGR